MFLKTLDVNYSPLLHDPFLADFNGIVKKAEDIEQGVADGILIDQVLVQNWIEQLQTGAISRKSGKKKEEDVSLILPQSSNAKKNWNSSGGSSSNAQNVAKAQGNTAQGGRVDKWPRDRVFTFLGDTYENILALLVKEKKITSFLRPPNHDPSARNFNANERCTYHSSAAGHSTEKCWALKHRIQDLIDAGEVVVQAEDAPNVQKNPFPNHAGANAVEIGEDAEMKMTSFPITKLKESEDRERSMKESAVEAKLKKDVTRMMFNEVAWDDVKLQPSISEDDTGAVMQMMFLPPESAKGGGGYEEKKNT